MRGLTFLSFAIFLFCREVSPALVDVNSTKHGILAPEARDVRDLCHTPFSIHGRGAQQVCKTYVFATTFLDLWNVSRDYCRSLSDVFGVPMDLTAIESREENDVIKQTVQADFSSANFWTSGTDRARTYIMYWDATGRTVDYFDWLSDTQPGGYRLEDEVSIVLVGGGWYTNYVAGNVRSPLCEQNTPF